MDLFIGVGLAIAGYFICDGLRNYRNPTEKSFVDYFKKNDQRELLAESSVHHFLGIKKEEVRMLIQEHPDIPHVKLNGQVYFSKTKLREWIKE